MGGARPVATCHATFDEFKVPETEHRELLALLLPMRDDIVEVKVAGDRDASGQLSARAASELTAAAREEGLVCRFVIAAIR